MGRKRRGSNTGISGLSFSWRKAVGITDAKRKLARATGLPTTRTGRQRKLAGAMGCLIILISITMTILTVCCLSFVGLS